MVNRILNIVATGVWQELVDANGFPQRTRAVSIQVRESQTDMYYHWRGQTEYWTIRAGTSRTIEGEFWPGDLFVMSTLGVTMEIEISTQLTM